MSLPSEHTPLLQPGKGKSRNVDAEDGLPAILRTTSSTFGNDLATVNSIADALAVEIYRRDPNPVVSTNEADDTIGTSTDNLAPSLDIYSPLFQAHQQSLNQAFPITSTFSHPKPHRNSNASNITGTSSHASNKNVLQNATATTAAASMAQAASSTAGGGTTLGSEGGAGGGAGNEQVDDDIPAMYPSPRSAAFLLCATLTLLERSTALKDPPSRGELGVERAIRARATREKMQQSLVDMAVNLLNEPLSGRHFVSTPMNEHDPVSNRDQGQDESVTVLWSEWTVSENSPKVECAADILIRILNGPFATRGETICYPLMAHPVLLASADYVWTNGLYPESSSWKKRLLRPFLLHFQSLVFYIAWTVLTFYITLQSEYKHMYHFNPLTPKEGSQTVGQGIAWYLWLIFAVGHALQAIRLFLLPRFPIGCGPPLIADTLIVLAVVLRLCHLQLDFAYILLSYALPLLLLSIFVLPSTPSFAFIAKSHLPKARLALRTMTTRLEGLAQVAWYLLFSLGALGWAMSGDINISNPFLAVLEAPITITTNTPSPIESRTSIAGGILLGLVFAWMLGDAYGSAPRRITSSDADGWEGEFGRMIALSARTSHLQATRYFLPRHQFFLPPPLNLISFIFQSIPLTILRILSYKDIKSTPILLFNWTRKLEYFQTLMVIPFLLFLDTIEKCIKFFTR